MGTGIREGRERSVPCLDPKTSARFLCSTREERLWKRKPGPKSGLESGANGRRRGDRIRMEFRKEEKHLSSPHSELPGRAFRTVNFFGKGVERGMWRRNIFRSVVPPPRINPRPVTGLLPFARGIRTIPSPLLPSAKSFSLLSTFLYFHVSLLARLAIRIYIGSPFHLSAYLSLFLLLSSSYDSFLFSIYESP